MGMGDAAPATSGALRKGAVLPWDVPDADLFRSSRNMGPGCERSVKIKSLETTKINQN